MGKEGEHYSEAYLFFPFIMYSYSLCHASDEVCPWQSKCREYVNHSLMSMGRRTLHFKKFELMNSHTVNTVNTVYGDIHKQRLIPGSLVRKCN